MDSTYDYKQYALLYVDDEERSLKQFTRAFADTFRILTAPNAQEAFQLLETHQNEIAVVMTDQRMPGELGVQFLERTRRLCPRTIRILATAFADLDAAIDAVNSGAIYKYITKPWNVPMLETTLKRSLEFYIVQTERDLLLREKLSTLHRMVITDRVLSLGVIAAGLGHQLRNAMQAIRTFLDLTPAMLHQESLDLNRLRHPAFWQDFHRSAQTRLRQILDLLADLAEGTSTPAAQDTSVHIHEAINAAIQGFEPEFTQRRLQVTNLVSPSLPALQVDQRRFNKLFTLLLRNELQTLPDGSSVRFEASLRLAAGNRPAEIDILVNDNGPGLPRDAILALFDPMMTQKDSPQEFGVYLMACYFIVYHHGGRIQIRQDAEQGLALTISLPLSPPVLESVNECEDFLMRAMTNERLWERFLAGV